MRVGAHDAQRPQPGRSDAHRHDEDRGQERRHRGTDNVHAVEPGVNGILGQKVAGQPEHEAGIQQEVKHDELDLDVELESSRLLEEDTGHHLALLGIGASSEDEADRGGVAGLVPCGPLNHSRPGQDRRFLVTEGPRKRGRALGLVGRNLVHGLRLSGEAGLVEHGLASDQGNVGADQATLDSYQISGDEHRGLGLDVLPPTLHHDCMVSLRRDDLEELLAVEVGDHGDREPAQREDAHVDESHVPVAEVEPRPRHEDLVRVEWLAELLEDDDKPPRVVDVQQIRANARTNHRGLLVGQAVAIGLVEHGLDGGRGEDVEWQEAAGRWSVHEIDHVVLDHALAISGLGHLASHPRALDLSGQRHV